MEIRKLVGFLLCSAAAGCFSGTIGFEVQRDAIFPFTIQHVKLREKFEQEPVTKDFIAFLDASAHENGLRMLFPGGSSKYLQRFLQNRAEKLEKVYGLTYVQEHAKVAEAETESLYHEDAKRNIRRGSVSQRSALNLLLAGDPREHERWLQNSIHEAKEISSVGMRLLKVSAVRGALSMAASHLALDKKAQSRRDASLENLLPAFVEGVITAAKGADPGIFHILMGGYYRTLFSHLQPEAQREITKNAGVGEQKFSVLSLLDPDVLLKMKRASSSLEEREILLLMYAILEIVHGDVAELSTIQQAHKQVQDLKKLGTINFADIKIPKEAQPSRRSLNHIPEKSISASSGSSSSWRPQSIPYMNLFPVGNIMPSLSEPKSVPLESFRLKDLLLDLHDFFVARGLDPKLVRHVAYGIVGPNLIFLEGGIEDKVFVVSYGQGLSVPSARVGYLGKENAKENLARQSLILRDASKILKILEQFDNHWGGIEHTFAKDNETLLEAMDRARALMDSCGIAQKLASHQESEPTSSSAPETGRGISRDDVRYYIAGMNVILSQDFTENVEKHIKYQDELFKKYHAILMNIAKVGDTQDMEFVNISLDFERLKQSFENDGS